ncbi:nuclear mRNA export, poly(A)+RNA binding protein [Ciborinia camelliae]|nr:nuclear mRNA export, poly(A)+RNA binding protein [Ciborinia camelliae]
MMNRTSGPPKGPRNSSSGARGSGRVGGGGISKRRGPVRVDKDGDLDMDAATGANGRKSGKGAIGGSVPTGPRGHGRGGARNTGRGGKLDLARNPQAILRGMGSQSQQANVLVTLWVKGLKGSKAASNSDQGVSSLVSFLERKATTLDSKSKRVVRVKKSHKKGDIVVISVSPEDAATILKLDGFAFAGSTIGVQDSEPSATSEQKEESEEARLTREKIQAVLAARYDPNLKLLNLSALGQDAKLNEMGMFLDSNTVSKLIPVLMAICNKLFTTRQAKKEAIVSITLADNELVNLDNVTTLASTFPDLKNLDLSRNKFSDLDSLKLWRWKFRHLEKLILTHNPIETITPDYTTEIVRWYPELQELNGVQVRSVAQVVADLEAIQSPFPIASPSFRDAGKVGEIFVKHFLANYDTERNYLLDNYYDAQTTFSLSINMTAVRDRNHSMPIPPWAAYNKFNRNLSKYTHLSTRLSRKFTGIKSIQPIWNELPKTAHPDIVTRPQQYLVECQPLPGVPDPSGMSETGVDGLLITIHGEFEEEIANFEGKAFRSFSRTFIIGPGGANGPTMPGGPPVRVISDLLALRAWSPLAKTSAQAAQILPSPDGLLPAEHQEALLEQRRAELAQRLAVETGMNIRYCQICLMETDWDLEEAYLAFQGSKADLPEEAFQPLD